MRKNMADVAGIARLSDGVHLSDNEKSKFRRGKQKTLFIKTLFWLFP